MNAVIGSPAPPVSVGELIHLSVGSEIHPLAIARKLGGWLPARRSINKLPLLAAREIGQVDAGHFRLEGGCGGLEVRVNQLRTIGTPGGFEAPSAVFRR